MSRFDRTHFQREGYAVLRSVLAPEVVAGARRELETLVDAAAQLLQDQGKIRDLRVDAPFETRLFELYMDHLDDMPKLFRGELHRPGLYEVFFSPRLLDVVESILGPEIRLYPNYSARPKLPDWEGTQVLWHQDGGYTEGEGVSELRMVNVWTPLVQARVENGCMQFIPGTHRLGVVPHVRRTHYLEIAAEVLEPRLADAVDIELDPGDVVLFHNLLFHQGQPNRAKTIRWSLDWRYQDATQPTLRKQNGHIARSRVLPAVSSAQAWASLVFG